MGVMKTAVYLLVLCFLGSCFAAHLQSSGLGWQGTWSENKRSFGGNMYICVDIENNVAYGSYSGAGLFSGVLKGTEFTGEWFEAGYDRPFGPFSLTLSGTSFSGSWSYYNNTSADSTETFAWSGSRSSSSRPSVEQCLVPAQGVAVTGTYENVENICYRPADRYQNTNLPGVFGGFESFGFVGGYTPDAGRSVFMSDFVYRNDDSISLRPETSASVFGPCSSNSDCNGPNTGDDSERVQTQKLSLVLLSMMPLSVVSSGKVSTMIKFLMVLFALVELEPLAQILFLVEVRLLLLPIADRISEILNYCCLKFNVFWMQSQCLLSLSFLDHLMVMMITTEPVSLINS